MDDNDKIIRLAGRLEINYFGEAYLVDFAESDYANEFMPGDTARLIDAAAKIAKMTIVLKGSNSARLVKDDEENGVSFRMSSFDED